jgi:hypothetical protein
MKVQARGVNVKRHTISWKIGGKWRSRAEAVRLAKKGKVDNVVVRRGSNDEMHISGHPFRMKLYNLPTKVMPKGSIKPRKAARR